MVSANINSRKPKRLRTQLPSYAMDGHSISGQLRRQRKHYFVPIRHLY